MSDALDLMAALRLEDGRRWGEAAEPWQWQDAEAVLDPESPTPYSFLTRPRGGSKTADLGGMTIAAMLTQAPAGARLYALAADRDQGRLFVDSMSGFLARTPDLRGALKVDAYKVATARRGVVLEILAADAPSAWGLRPWLVVVDELAQWPATSGPRTLWEAVSSAVAKVPGARMVVLTTAGDPAHWSRGVLEHARADALWRVHEVPGPVPWLDPARLAEQRRRLPDSSYRRLFLNEWTAAEDRLVDPGDLAACVVLDGPLEPEQGRRYVVGLDVGLRKDATAAAVCHRDADARIVLDRLQVWAPSRGQTVELSEVEAWLAETARLYRPCRVVFDPYQAIQLAQGLRRTGVATHEFVFTAASVGRLAVNLHQLLRDRRLSLPDDEPLLEELRNVRLKETSPGVLRLDHDSDKHDDRAVALALAALDLAAAPTGEVRQISYRPDLDTPTYTRGEVSLVGRRYIDAA